MTVIDLNSVINKKKINDVEKLVKFKTELKQLITKQIFKVNREETYRIVIADMLDEVVSTLEQVMLKYNVVVDPESVVDYLYLSLNEMLISHGIDIEEQGSDIDWNHYLTKKKGVERVENTFELERSWHNGYCSLEFSLEKNTIDLYISIRLCSLNIDSRQILFSKEELLSLQELVGQALKPYKQEEEEEKKLAAYLEEEKIYITEREKEENKWNYIKSI